MTSLDEYVAGRKAYEERESPLKVRITNLNRHLAISLCANVCLCIGLFWMATHRPAVVPFGFLVDQVGHAQAIGTVVTGSDSLLETVKQNALLEWVKTARTVLSDWPAQEGLVRRVMTQTANDPNGQSFMHQWYVDNRPDLRAKEGIVIVQTKGVIPLAGSRDTYEVDWTEQRTTSNGDPLDLETWKGYFKVSIRPPATLGAPSQNPLGFYVTEVHWSKQNA